MTLSSTRDYPARSAAKSANFVATIADPQFAAVTIFCAIGLLATLNLIVRMPDLAAFLY